MDSSNKTLLNLVLSVLAPVLILDNCSTSGPKFYELGTTWALVLALALPLGYGIYLLVSTRKLDPLNLLGLLGTVLTAVVSIYANTGETEAIRPSTPWFYAAKEALIALLMAGAIIVSARASSERSLLRLFVYSEAIFDIKRIENSVAEQSLQSGYESIQWRASLLTAASLILSATANFGLSLYYLLPVLHAPLAEQALAYNHAVSRLTWMGYLIIGVPLLGTLMAVIAYLVKSLSKLTGLDSGQVRM